MRIVNNIENILIWYPPVYKKDSKHKKQGADKSPECGDHLHAKGTCAGPASRTQSLLLYRKDRHRKSRSM